MIKRLIYIGLLLLAISIVSYYAVFSSIVSQTVSSPGQNITRVYDNYSLSGNSINVFAFNSTPYNTSVYLERSDEPIDVFLLNSTGYGLWRSRLNSSSGTGRYLSLAKSLEGMGAIIIYSNVTNATIPVTFSVPLYLQNESNISLGLLGAGRFYVLSALPPGPPARNATITSTLAEGISLRGSAGRLSEFSVAGIASTLMFVAGLIIILVGIMKQDTKKQNEEIRPEAIDRLYKGIRNSSSEDFAARRRKHKPNGRDAGRSR